MGLRLLRLGVGAAFLIGAACAWNFWDLNPILAIVVVLGSIFMAIPNETCE